MVPPEQHSEDQPVEFIGLMFRITALLIDHLLMIAVAAGAVALLFGAQLKDMDPSRVPDLVEPLLRMVVIPAHVLTFVLPWGIRGATLGNWLLSSRLVSFRTGGSPGLARALLRYLAGFLALACLGIGFFLLLRNPHKRGWHDRLSGTALIGDESLRAPTEYELHEDRFAIKAPPWLHG